MKPMLLPLREQTVVITGASSGVGLMAARAAARQGARVVLAARDAPSLRHIVDDIRLEGGRAIDVVTDGSDESQVARLADRAIAEFGAIDTWVNCGDYVNGSRAAVRRMRGRGGALINLTGRRADRALEAFTHALRREVEDEGAPISVRLVKPSSDAILHAATHPMRKTTVGGVGVELLTAAAIVIALGTTIVVVAGSAERGNEPTKSRRRFRRRGH